MGGPRRRTLYKRTQRKLRSDKGMFRGTQEEFDSLFLKKVFDVWFGGTRG
jgi:hypothetical protein